MGSFLRITLLSLFAAAGVGAAICVALFAMPGKHRPLPSAVPEPAALARVEQTASPAHLFAVHASAFDAEFPANQAPRVRHTAASSPTPTRVASVAIAEKPIPAVATPPRPKEATTAATGDHAEPQFTDNLATQIREHAPAGAAG